MAEGRRIRFCVLEGNYVELAEAGAPIPVCLQMHNWNFPWESAVVYKTDVRGFSVSFLAHVAGKARRTSVPGRRARDVESQRSGLTKVHGASWQVVSALRAINLTFY